MLQNGAKDGEAAVEEPGTNDDVVVATAVADDATAEEMKADVPAEAEDAKPADEAAPAPTEPAAAVNDGTETLMEADRKEEEESRAQQSAKQAAAAEVVEAASAAALVLQPEEPAASAAPVPKVTPHAASTPDAAAPEAGAAQQPEESPRYRMPPSTHACTLPCSACSCAQLPIRLAGRCSQCARATVLPQRCMGLLACAPPESAEIV